MSAPMFVPSVAAAEEHAGRRRPVVPAAPTSANADANVPAEEFPPDTATRCRPAASCPATIAPGKYAVSALLPNAKSVAVDAVVVVPRPRCS